MEAWDELCAPLGLPREPLAPAASRARRNWMAVAAAAGAAALVPVTSLAPGRAPPHTDVPAPIAAAEAPAPVAMLEKPPIAEAPLALRPLVPAAEQAKPADHATPASEGAAKVARKAPSQDGPLIINVAEALAAAKHGQAAEGRAEWPSGSVSR